MTAALGGPVSLDRLGLRDVPAESVGEAIGEALGAGVLVAVAFEAEMPSAGGGREGTGGVLVVFGGRLLRELTAVSFDGAATFADEPRGAVVPAAPASVGDTFVPVPRPSAAEISTNVQRLLARAKGLRLTVSAEIGRRRVRMADLVRLAPGGTIDLGKDVSRPLDLWIGSRRIGEADAVVVKGHLGVRLRGRR